MTVQDSQTFHNNRPTTDETNPLIQFNCRRSFMPVRWTWVLSIYLSIFHLIIFETFSKRGWRHAAKYITVWKLRPRSRRSAKRSSLPWVVQQPKCLAVKVNVNIRLCLCDYILLFTLDIHTPTFWLLLLSLLLGHIAVLRNQVGLLDGDPDAPMGRGNFERKGRPIIKYIYQPDFIYLAALRLDKMTMTYK